MKSIEVGDTVRIAVKNWWVISRSMATDQVYVERTFWGHDNAMDYARQLAIGINGWAK